MLSKALARLPLLQPPGMMNSHDRDTQGTYDGLNDNGMFIHTKCERIKRKNKPHDTIIS